jgi:hypothetical protein
MKEDLAIGFVVIILDDESICAVDKPIGANIPIDLLESAESLCDIHACLSDDGGMLVESFPDELYFLAALVVEHHFKGPTLPVPRYEQVVLSRL